MAVGRCALTTRPTAINQDLKALLFTKDVDRRFFIRLLRYHGPTLDRVSVGSTVRGITLGDLLSLKLSYPEAKQEQSRIAAVLDTIDEAIAKTEAVIAKLKQVRAGLLHDLLTRGLDGNGQLRYPIAHPEQFQDSPIGRIPRGWQIELVGQIFEMQLGKMLSPKAKGGGDTRPYVGNRHVLWDRVDCSDPEYMDFTPDERTKFALQVDDILVCEGGEVGRTAIWRGELEECFFQKAIHRLRSKDNRIIPQYMLAFMKRAAERGAFVNLTSQTSIAHLTQEKLALLQVVLPPRSEQEKMVELWTTLDVGQQNEEIFLKKLQQLKSALMADLLTGRVRVPADLDFG
jgi:type I restriction enzyme S subunit